MRCARSAAKRAAGWRATGGAPPAASRGVTNSESTLRCPSRRSCVGSARSQKRRLSTSTPHASASTSLKSSSKCGPTSWQSSSPASSRRARCAHLAMTRSPPRCYPCSPRETRRGNSRSRASWGGGGRSPSKRSHVSLRAKCTSCTRPSPSPLKPQHATRWRWSKSDEQ